MALPRERSRDPEWEVDRHKLWRRILADYEELKAITPEGYQPYVQVYLKSRVQPFEIGFVRTLRDPDYPWVRFELATSAPREEGGPVPADSEWIYFHESDVERVEMKLRERPPGYDFFAFEIFEGDVDE